jgi:hypothetical protein
MIWLKEQTEKHKNNFETFREKYLKGENGSSSIADIQNNKRRCATLVHKVNSTELNKVREELQGIEGFYSQEIPHFTIDCHRYLTDDRLPDYINAISLEEQKENLITEEELKSYDKILREIIGNEKFYDFELKGVAIGGDGLIAQVWFDYERMNEMTSRLGEKVRSEIPTMDFQWGIVKHNVPIRVLNLTRFTGDEDKNKVLEYVDKNKNRLIGNFSMRGLDLLASDHYIQKKNTLELGKYDFKI